MSLAQPHAEALAFASQQPRTMPGEAPDARPCLEVYRVLGDDVQVLPMLSPGHAVRLVGTGDPGRADGATHGGASARGETLVVPTEVLPFEGVTVLEATDHGWALRFDERWGGWITSAGERRPLHELRLAATREPDGLWRLPLQADDQVQLHVGPVALVARQVRPARRVAPVPFWRVDPTALGALSFGVFLVVMLGVVVAVTPPAPASTLQASVDRHVDLPFRPSPPPPPPTVSPKQERVEQGGRATPSRRTRAGGGSPRGGSAISDALAGVALGSDLPEGMRVGIDRLVGARPTGGRFGLGGRNLGGNGDIESAGGVGTGRRPGSGGDGDAWGGAQLVKQTGRVLVAEEPVTLLGIRADAVDKVVKQNLAAIRYCYQRELQKQPALAGKISVKFTITKDGSVSSATTASSTLGSPAAEACVQSRFLRMQFPAIEGGGIAIVKYPFVFAPG